ncbi:hypothetical protein PIB30_063538 [Stylosanthes scabra]|uniref:Uncharacterized protein n=1 Tax=Stylosanthes scabra TaxID=79078 RepID=A0ABU6RMC9_9FABA|nr:hypothetical protein [Stylosanthes scabra]
MEAGGGMPSVICLGGKNIRISFVVVRWRMRLRSVQRIWSRDSHRSLSVDWEDVCLRLLYKLVPWLCGLSWLSCSKNPWLPSSFVKILSKRHRDTSIAAAASRHCLTYVWFLVLPGSPLRPPVLRPHVPLPAGRGRLPEALRRHLPQGFHAFN